MGEDTTTFTLRGTSIPGATVSIKDAAKDQPYRVTADANGQLDGRRRPPPRPQPVRHQRARPGDRQGVREHRARAHHRAVPRHRGADAHRRLARRGRAVRERGDPGPGHDVERRHRVDQGRPDRHGRRQADRDPAPTVAPDPSAPPGASAAPAAPAGPTVGPDDRRRSAPTGRSTRRSTCPPGKWQIIVTATSAEGKAVTLTRDVAIVYKGVNLVVSIKGVDGLAQGLGRRQGLQGHGRRRHGLQPGQGADVHGAATRSRSGPASPARRSSRSTARTSGGCPTRATPRPGCSPRPTRRSGPTGPDGGATRSSTSPRGSRRGAWRGA